jgi:hypothetical protein
MQIFIRRLVVAAVLSTSALGAEHVERTTTAGEFALQAVAERPRAYATVCVSKRPSMKADFDKALGDLRKRVQAIGAPLLKSDRFKSLNRTPPPKEIVEALAELNNELLAQIKDADADRDCPKFLSNLALLDGELLKSGVMQSLAAMQGGLAAIERGVVK